MPEVSEKNKEALEHILGVLDSDSFVEIGEKIAAGVITGYGSIDGCLVYVFAQDRNVRGGSFGKAQAGKLTRLYTMAIRSKAPVIGFLDCAGIRIEEGAEALAAFADVYKIQAEASGTILQIMTVCGECIGCMETMSALSDIVIRNNTDTSEKIRSLINMLPASVSGSMPLIESEDDLNRACSSISAKKEKGAELLKELSDDGKFIEINKESAREISTGFIALAGRAVGGIAADTGMIVSREGSIKTAEFINMCSKFQIPLLNVIGGCGFDEPASANMIIKALSNSDIMIVNMIAGEACGSYYSVFNSKGCGMDYTLMWDDASVQIINPLHAADILYPNLSLKELEEKAAEYKENQCSAEAMARCGYADKIIRPEESRKYLIGAFETLANVRR